MTQLSAQFQFGALRIAALSDGVGGQQPTDWFPGVPDADWMPAVAATDARAALPVNFGSFLIRGGGRTVLIDTGNGNRLHGQHHGAAGLLDRIAALGVQPSEVDTVLLTHFHGDHVGWNVEHDDGPITFANATYYLSEVDAAYLANPATPSTPGNDFSRSRINPLFEAGRLETFDGEFTPLEGMTMVPTPGHTPGHCSVLIESQGERLFVVGDAAPSVAHLEHPEWSPVFDLDVPRASASRRALADRAIRDQALLTGGHFPILTVGRLHEAAPGYRWEPVEVEQILEG